jgi:hypothetical protein
MADPEAARVPRERRMAIHPLVANARMIKISKLGNLCFITAICRL